MNQVQNANMLPPSPRARAIHWQSGWKNQIAYFDSLTGLPNRLLLEERIRVAISDTQRTEDTLAILIVDLDNLKVVNGLFGHAVGDEMLKTCAKRILACSQERDIVARLSGDKFVLTLTNLADEAHARVAAASAAKQLVEAFSHSVMLYKYETILTPSIGIAIYPRDADNVIDLIRHADTATYGVRSTGRNDYKFFSSSLNVTAMRRFEIDSLLHQALSRNEFVLHYQPQVDNSGVIVGMEALLRWHSPVLGDVSPAEFIPLAEESGAILSIGEWVIRTACQQRRHWQDYRLCADSCYIAVNVSPCQLQQLDFVEKVTAIVHEVGVHPQQINIEITEGVLITDAEDIKQKLSELRAQGFRISVDDFGIGYSSLTYLKHFPIDVLKIDRTFVQDIGTSRNDEAISRAIINLAESLGIKTVAEGVETMAQVQFLRTHGCEAYQGYYFSKPVSALKMGSLLQK